MPEKKNITKVGERGRHIVVPEGWERVESGLSKPGDQFLRCPDYDGWMAVEADDVGFGADTFDCLIREVEKE